MTMMKHVGVVKNTSRKCVVVMMSLPQDEGNALIIETDSLPDRLSDSLNDALTSAAGQESASFSDVLHRRMMPDGSGTMLEAFHHAGLLRREPVENINMLPMPNYPVPLKDILAQLRAMSGQEVKPIPTNYSGNQTADAVESRTSLAKSILFQATELEREAARKREEAYRVAPELRPVEVVTSPEVGTSPVISPVISPMMVDPRQCELPLVSPNEVLDKLRQ